MVFTFSARHNIIIHIPVRIAQVIYNHIQIHDTI